MEEVKLDDIDVQEFLEDAVVVLGTFRAAFPDPVYGTLVLIYTTLLMEQQGEKSGHSFQNATIVLAELAERVLKRSAVAPGKIDEGKTTPSEEERR